MIKDIKRIGMMTSGGDAPGMNAALRAVVRTTLHYDRQPVGIYRGYAGMIDGAMEDLTSHSVSNIIQRGGTFLKSARSKAFYTEEGRKKAYVQLKEHNIDALVAIGGDGTFTGAHIMAEEFGIPIVGIPGTIDNDLYGTDFTIGYDSAINTAVDAIDKIRDTADSHDRLFFVEVMGRDAGLIALRCGIAGGAEAILVPESRTDIDKLITVLEKGWEQHKTSSIVVVAEGEQIGGAIEVARMVNEKFDYYDTRVSILGHVQRGGNPTCQDRVLASRMGIGAVEALLNGRQNEMIGVVHKDINYTPLENAVKYNIEINKNLLGMVEILAGY